MKLDLPLLLLAAGLVLATPTTASAQFGAFGQNTDQEEIDRGKAVFEMVCKACHTIDPPHGKAPPLRHVARHVKEEKSSRTRFTEHVIAFAASPSEEAAVMPAHVIERFGLMPPLPLPEGQLRDVAAYMWSLTQESDASGNGGG